ncbi:VOC family protein [Ornithinibacillus californiensis]|uniref:VOC family protein n=1 Tax=Ornithinibacillus californiensis TaxID=161536 RepID=UPI00064D8F35|nr:VOC family protein [Ornithinibacillus californiensis]
MVKRISPYLVTNGNGQEAVNFYQAVLGAELLGLQTFGDNPMEGQALPEEAKDLVLHALLKIGNSELMISDNFPGSPYRVGDHLSIAIMLESPEEAKEIFAKLTDDGKVVMDLQKTFWSPMYGQVQDKFGVLWQVSTEGE